MLKEKIYELKQYIETINKYLYSGYVFRGLNDINYEQIPTILYNNDSDDCFMKNENDDIQQLRNISNNNTIDFVTLYEIARHYGFKSRLVDYSFNPFVSLYFACKDKNTEKDSKVICFNLHKYYEDNKNETNKGKQLTSEDIEKLYLDLLDDDCVGQDVYDDFENKGFYKFKNPMFIIPIKKDNRINNQNGLFLLWPDICNKKKVLEYLNYYCTEIIIDSYSKKLILKELDKYGYNNDTIIDPHSSIVTTDIRDKIIEIIKIQENRGGK